METQKINNLQQKLCDGFCREIKIVKIKENIIIETPFYFPDGDMYQIYLKELGTGGFRLTDNGHTLMHLSYENDIESFYKGSRNILLENIKNELDIKEDNGEFYVDSLFQQIPENLFRFGQALTKIQDITFLNRTRVQKTFYEDLYRQLISIVDKNKFEKEFFFQDDEKKEYEIDYKVDTKDDTFFFIFGIPNKDKAQLTTIILERLLRKKLEFSSLVIFEDFHNIGKSVGKRLMNVSNEMIDSLSNKEDLARKIKQKIA